MLAPHNSGYAAKEGMDGPTIVMVNTMIRSISKIDDYKMVSRAIFWQCYLFLQFFARIQKQNKKQTWNCKIQLYFSLHVESQLHYTTNFGSIVEFFAWLFKIINRFFGLASLVFIALCIAFMPPLLKILTDSQMQKPVSDEITAGFLLWQHPKAKYGYIWAKTYHTCPVFVVSP